MVHTASKGGKSVLYIVPIQAEIDMTPLPLNSKEFDDMPKACCRRCNKAMPLVLLEVHVKSCGSESLSYSKESATVDSAEEGSTEVSDCSLVFAKPQC